MRKFKYVVLAAAALALMSGELSAQDAGHGRQVFVQKGCWQCHGFEGQGASTGPKLGPDPLPFDAMRDFVRTTNGPMPPYSAQLLSDSELADIHAYLASRPPPKDHKTIPLLSN
jgi:ubiquinol-cytochrome c reductase cytochrome c subunit